MLLRSLSTKAPAYLMISWVAGVKVYRFGKIGPSSCMVVLHGSSFVVYMFVDLTTSVPEVVFFYYNHSPWGLMVSPDLVGTVAYKLKLPVGSQIHDVFHVSQLKRVHGSHQGQMPAMFPQVKNEGLLEVTPLKILERKLVKKNNVVAMYGLIQSRNGITQDATWELLADIYKKFPLFDS
ncbi:hypothetical protein Tco_0475079 [Tanacetum coccineum]